MRILMNHQSGHEPERKRTIQMSTPKQETLVPRMGLDVMMDLLAPPPVLSTESLDSYLALRDQFVSSFKPRNFFELRLAMEVVDAAWHIKRYTFHKTLGIERWYRKNQEFQERRRKLQEACKDGFVQQQAETMTQTPSDIAAIARLEEKHSEVIEEVDHAVTWTAEEIGHNDALERSMPFQESLEKLIASATVRFYKATEAFEHYREIFGSQVRKQAETILETADYEDFQEFLDDAPAPSIAARPEISNASKKHNRSHAAR
jgi:hypothetical protein